jgi:hypothetical protein
MIENCFERFSWASAPKAYPLRGKKHCVTVTHPVLEVLPYTSGEAPCPSLASAARYLGHKFLAQKGIKIGKKGCLFGSGELPKRHKNIRRLCVILKLL